MNWASMASMTAGSVTRDTGTSNESLRARHHMMLVSFGAVEG